MAAYFFDSSALVKAYIAESGSDWVRSIMDPTAANDVHIVRMTEVEITSAVIRRKRAGTLTSHKAAVALDEFRRDARYEFHLIGIETHLIASAIRSAEAHGLRAYDALQLASALALKNIRSDLALSPLILASSDQELNAAARSEGILVEDPNNYP